MVPLRIYSLTHPTSPVSQSQIAKQYVGAYTELQKIRIKSGYPDLVPKNKQKIRICQSETDMQTLLQ